MKYYTYFPGCSVSDGASKAYGWSARAVARVLDVKLQELEDWNCCGSTPCISTHGSLSFCLSARNLALAEKNAFDLVTPCSGCFVTMNRTNVYLRESPKLKAEVDEALAAGGLAYRGTVKVRTILDMFVNDIGFDLVKSKVKNDLSELKVASYYGCQVVRPKTGLDHPEFPESLDKLVASLGAKVVDFPLKSHCCGGSLIISEESIALDLMKKLLECAQAKGADCLVTVCPLCQVNLDAYQGRVNKRFGTNFKLPVLFFTQLMGMAFGLSDDELGLRTGIVPVGKELAKYL